MRILYGIVFAMFVVGSTMAYLSKGPHQALSRSYFDTSLGVTELGEAFLFELPADQHMRHIAKTLIEQRKRPWERASEDSIPLLLHQIWPYQRSVPDELARAASLVQAQHSTCTYKLWRPQDFAPLIEEIFGSVWKDLSPYIVRDLAAASILTKEGGIVVDLEAECVQPITDILSLGTCLIGFEPPLPQPRYQRRLFLSPSVIAATPGHKTITAWAQTMQNRISYIVQHGPIDPLFVCQESLTSIVASSETNREGLLLLGPIFFSPIAPAHIKSLQRQLDGLKKPPLLRRIGELIGILTPPPFSSIHRMTIFVHMHGGRQSRKYLGFESLPKESKEALS